MTFISSWTRSHFVNSLLQSPLYCIVLYCIVLKAWSLLSTALRPFQIYCAPPNLGITRTWICRINYAQRPIFSGLRFFNEPEILDSGPPAWSPSRRTCAQYFYVLKKSINLSRVWTLEASTLLRDHRSRKVQLNAGRYKFLVRGLRYSQRDRRKLRVNN